MTEELPMLVQAKGSFCPFATPSVMVVIELPQGSQKIVIVSPYAYGPSGNQKHTTGAYERFIYL